VATFWGGDIPWVTPGELTELRTKYLSRTRESITRAGLAGSSTTLVPKDSLLVTTRATIGSLALVALPMTTNQGFKTLIFVGGADPSFYYHCFRRLTPELVRLASGTTFLEIGAGDFRQVLLPWPPPPEQRRIAEILDSLDDAIRATEQVIAKLELMRRGLLHDLLIRGLGEQGDSRRQHSDVSALPEHDGTVLEPRWPRVSLGELVSVITKGTTPTSIGRSYSASGIPFLRVENISEDGAIDYSQMLRVDLRTHGALLRSQLHPLDVLLSIAGTLGRSAVWPESAGTANCNQAVAIIRPKPGRLDPAFLSAYLRSDFGSAQVLARSVQLAQANLSLAEVGRISLRLPTLGEQRRIVERLQAATAQIRRERELLQKAARVRAGLADDLLTGRTRVQTHQERRS